MTTIPKQGPVIAIDGPAGTGKSSTTRKLSDTLGFTHIDTGALYRAIAFLLLEESGNDPARIHEDRATELARSVHLDFKRVAEKNPPNRVFANGRDVTEFIRTPIVSTVASRISAFSGVRSALLGLQRRMGCVGRTILEGRDIGTVIFPDADIKFFLTANVEERAKRRLAELEAAGSHALSFEVIKQQIIARV
jgi:CMP/dCMP kinase